MRERINRLAKGIVDSDMPEISIAPESFDSLLKTGETLRAELAVNSTNGIHLKGLVYADHSRVKVQNASFGGTRNRITFDVDCRYMEIGEEIAGNLVLVTNAGEYRVPFRFRTVSGSAGKTIGSIRTTEQFAAIAKADRESALRLFAYREFINAPFMQDMKVRALYSAFSAGSNRESAMEEFLVASGGKKPVSLKADEAVRSFALFQGTAESSIRITIENPGWFALSVKADADFIRLSKRSVTVDDFTDGQFDFPFSLISDALHSGKNTGMITFTSEALSFSVPVTAYGPEHRESGTEKEVRLARKRHFVKYAEYRVRYFCTRDESLPVLMTGELNAAAGCEKTQTEKDHLVLFRAEAALLAGDLDSCRALTESVAAGIRSRRQTDIYGYLLHEFICAMLPGDENASKKEAAVRLMRKYLKEKHMHSVFPMLIGADISLRSNPAAIMELIRFEFASGNRSPFLYAEYCRVLEIHPEFLNDLGKLELQAFLFGMREDMISPEMAQNIAGHAAALHTFDRLYCRLMKDLYGKYPSTMLLSAVCAVLIKGDIHTPKEHDWFEKGLEEKVRITGLYEYFLYTLPEQYDVPLPKEILLYFSYDNMLDDRSREKLYENIIRFLKPETKLWGEYKNQIEQFAAKQAMSGKINSHLAVIYRHVFRPETVDEKLSRVLPSILCSRKISCGSPYMKSAVIIYPELKNEAVCTLEEGTAFVPVFSPDAVLLFQNAYGNRFSNIPHTEEPACDLQELLLKCQETEPDQISMHLKRIREILSSGATGKEDMEFLEKALTKLPLSDLFRKKMLSVMITDTASDFLIRADKNMLSQAERTKACSALIHAAKFREAYEMIRTYGCENIEQDDLKKLCSKMILDRLFTEDRLLLHLADRTLDHEPKESVILDYLCEHYNGSTEEMLRILTLAIGEHTETYDLEERLLAQMLFTGNDQHMDQVFSWYINRKKASENIVRAYFTMKCAEYFLNDRETDSDIFGLIEKTFSGSIETGKAPVIWMLALTKYYATLNELSGDRKKLAEDLLESLLDMKLVFPYYKSLARFISVPGDITDKAIIEFHGDRDSRMEIRSRILPDRPDYRSEEMKRMYLGIFVRQMVLFSGETWEYEIYDITEGTPVFRTRGSVESDAADAGKERSRYGCLNNLTIRLRAGDEKGIREGMEQFTEQEETAERLFGLME